MSMPDFWNDQKKIDKKIEEKFEHFLNHAEDYSFVDLADIYIKCWQIRESMKLQLKMRELVSKRD